MEDCSTYLVCDGSCIIVMITCVLLNIWYLVLLLVCIAEQQHENTKSVDVDEDKTSETSETPKQIINEWHIYGSSI